jgi:uncharacterized protein YeaO (DUF488 family)
MGERQLSGVHRIKRGSRRRRDDRWKEKPMVKLKRVYDPVSRTDGARLLVERLWPRGQSKAKLHLTAWLKEVGPSTELRKWFNHDPLKWARFRARYFRELDAHPESWRPILTAARRGAVTLVYSSHDEEHNNAVALKEYLGTRGLRTSRSRSVAESAPQSVVPPVVRPSPHRAARRRD